MQHPPALATIEGVYTPRHIANFFLDKADEEGTALTQLHVIKLVYIAYGWTLAILNRKLFDEEIEAWPYGPVIPSLYHELKHYGRGPVLYRCTDFDYFTNRSVVPRVSARDEQVRLILTRVWESYKDFSSSDLIRMTHDIDTPWRDAIAKDRVLNDDLIKRHYQDRIRHYMQLIGHNEHA